jgi:hypothetical protein
MKIQQTILFLLLATYVQSQTYVAKNIAEFPLVADRFIGVDDYGSQYYIKGNTLFKKSSQGSYQYSALQLGTLSTADILNPLKLTLFYQGSNTAVILDNTLSEIKRISFSSIENFRNVSHANTANDRRLWIFNTDIQQLEIFDYNTNRIVQQTLPFSEVPLKVVSNFNFCWLLGPTGVSTFNNYGSFLETLPTPGLQSLSQYNGHLLTWNGTDFMYKPPETIDFQKIEIPKIPIKQFSLNDEILYIYDGQKVTSFRLEPPKD